ncbi:hypothetical protein RAZWK3B_16825 [Roseobacter sp. AzwK-3b]|nr:hypothetical protein RAZWK3B_16825 [Roseobacter sp. AzwK-3b]
MPMTLDIPPLHERADTPVMRKMLGKIAESENTLVEIRLPRLARKMGEDHSHSETQKLVEIAENCGWVHLKTNSVGSIKNIQITDAGRAMIGTAQCRPTRLLSASPRPRARGETQ